MCNIYIYIIYIHIYIETAPKSTQYEGQVLQIKISSDNWHMLSSPILVSSSWEPDLLQQSVINDQAI